MTRTAPPPEVIPASASKWAVSKAKPKGGQRIVIYGGGGKGKTSLAATLPSPMFIFLGSERPSTDVPNIPNVKSWEDIRAVLREPSLWTGVESIVIDSATVAEALAIDFTLRTVKTEKGGVVNSIEGYGYGKGYRHVNETFRQILADLDRHAEQGRNVVLVVHETIDNTPNPSGEDYKSTQPNLMQKGEAKLRDLVRDWCDHMLYIGYDIAVDDGKAKSSGSRCIYTQERATHWAKCRADPAKPVPYSILYPLGDDAVWHAIGIKKGQK